MKHTWKRMLSVVLAAVMLFSLLALPGFAAESDGTAGVSVDFEKVENDGRGRFQSQREALEDPAPAYTDEDIVRVSILLREDSTLAKGYEAASIAQNTAAKSYRASLRAKQDALAEKISKSVLGGETLDVVHNLTLAANLISANVAYGKLDAIRLLPEVKDVVLENRYEPEADAEVSDPNMAVSTGMTGTTALWSSGFTGAGSLVAIVDTGLDTDHQSFAASGFEYALSTLDKDVDLLTAEEVAEKWSELNASEFIDAASSAYLTSKVPFAVNYVDEDLDVTHDNDEQGGHGSHVSGIAAANRYIPNEAGGFDEALQTVKTQGVAPDAQILVMKVFGKGGGAYDSDYMLAVEDAMVLGAASVNLSLGSSVAGFVANDTYADLLDSLTESGTVWCNSAGNNNSWASNLGSDLYADDVNYATGGSPGSYTNSLAIASVDNDGFIGTPITLSDGSWVFYTESNGYGNAALTTIPGEYTYVLIDGDGSDFGDIDLTGKIALCMRGSISFYVKANNAVAKGAVATIIYNNAAGTINMNLTGYSYSAPAVSITQADGAKMKALGEEKTTEGGYTYYEGTLTVGSATDVEVDNYNAEYLTMSSFSSWGVPGDLSLKPELTTPGGNIWSVDGENTSGKAYYINSGTSMASPHAAGLVALLAQYFRETGLTETAQQSARTLAQSLLMSTSTPLVEEGSGSYYSLLKQGSGLANIEAAASAKSYILMDGSATASAADGKVKAELGELARTEDGKVSFSVAFALTNLSEEALAFDFDAEFFTQDIYEYEEVSYRDTWTTPLTAAVTWTVDGELYDNAGYLHCDFNGDGAVNGLDAQRLLDYCADNTLELNDADYADLDGDGDVDTYDAYLAFQGLNGAQKQLEPGQTAKVVANVTLNVPDELFGKDVNGNYVEGFLNVTEADTAEGVIGVKHSIPVLGFYGNWSDASMLDKGSVLDYQYEVETRDSYMNMAADLDNGVNTFTVKYAGNSTAYTLGGNPMVWDNEYYPERNAINSGDLISGVEYSLIRNAGAMRFFLTDSYGREIKGTEILGGSSYAAYYYASQSAWQATSSRAGLDFSLKNLTEGTKFNANFSVAPEYYANEDGSYNWSALGEGATMSLPLIIDNTAPDIVAVTRNTTEERDALIVSAHDNQYIALVALYTEGGDLISYYGGLDDVLRGEQVNYGFNLAEVEDQHLLVEVYDYALNLSTYKVNFNTEELENPDVQVTLNRNTAVIIGKGSIKLTASVSPWGFKDETVTWSTDDESVATVDQNGLVTGVSEGVAVITATSNFDPTKSDSCEVTVKFVDKTLNAFLWDEEGAVWFTEYNLNAIPSYTKLNDSNLRKELTGAFYDEDGTLYAITFDSEDWSSDVYTMDPETFELELVGNSDFGYMDACAAPSLDGDVFLAVYGTYLLIVSRETGEYVSAFNLTSFTGGSYLVGIAYEEALDYSVYGYGVTDWIFLLDANGNIYNTGLLNRNGAYSRFGVSKIGQIAEGVDRNYWQSLYFDGEDLFWNRFNYADNKVDIIMVDDLYTDGSVYNVGSFADSVWPVAGVMELGANPATGFAELNSASHKAAVIEADATLDVEKLSPDAAPAKGSLNAVKNPGVSAEKQAVSTDVTASYETEKDLTTNGLVTVTWNPATVTVTNVTTNNDHQALIKDLDNGKIVYAYVFDGEGVEAGTSVLTLTFASGSEGVVSIVTDEVNNEKPGTEEKITLGATVDDEPAETYTGPVWNWNEDLTEATATFIRVDGVTKVETAEIKSETTEATCAAEGKTVYTASVEFQGETYTDEKTVTLEKDPENHVGETEIRDAKEATCAAEGYTGDTYCTACGEKISEGEAIAKDPTNHVGETEIRDAKEATCAAEGYTGDTYCTACGEKISEGEAIAKNPANHTGETELRDVKEATCTEAGYTGNTYCADCGAVLAVGESIAALGHDWDEGQVTYAATCENVGVITYTCARCGETRTEIIPAKGHTPEAVAAVPATCTESGYTAGTRCAECGAILEGIELVPATGHTVVLDEAVAPTCTETGLTADAHCAVCETVLVAQETVDALGHEFGEWTVTKEATCTEAGEESRTCSRCDAVETREVEALGHDFVDGVCSRCGETDPDYEQPKDPCEGYTDINRKQWYHKAVDFVIANGYMGSTSSEKLTFSPSAKVSRAMVVSVLYRIAGSPEAEYKGTFSDVGENAWYTNAIEWAASIKLASGKGNGKFDPSGNVTRQELASFMFRFAAFQGKDTSGRADLSSFSDQGKIASWAAESVAWAVDYGLISGRSATELAPTGTATRAELAQIIMRFVEKETTAQ